MKNNEIWLGYRMRTLNYKTIIYTEKEKMNVIYQDLLESFKSINLQGTKPNKNWYSALPKYHNLWNFSELRFSIIFSIFKLLSIVVTLTCQKLGSVVPVQQKLKLSSPNSFMPSVSFYNPMKTSENLWSSIVFRAYRKKPLAWDGLTTIHKVKENIGLVSSAQCE